MLLLFPNDDVFKQNACSSKKNCQINRICCRLFIKKQTDPQFRKNAPTNFDSKWKSCWNRDNNGERSDQSEKVSKVQIDEKPNFNWHL